MHGRQYKITLSVVCLALIAVMLLPTSLAWFAARPLSPTGGEVMPGYFAGGDGITVPYKITRPIHLYNLAWLQATGRFNTKDPETGMMIQYKFELCDNLNMTGYTLPPIGTEKYPFIGSFTSAGGNKYTITNLTVSNVVDNGEIVKRPHNVSDLVGAEIVGFFGVIGQYKGVPDNTTYGNIVPYVAGFFLDNPTIRTQTQKSLVGLVAGYVNGKVHEVGVKGGGIVSGANNTAGLTDSSISYYALIGDRDASVGWSGVTAPGEGSGAIKVYLNDSQTYNNIDNIQNTNYVAEIPESKKNGAFVVGPVSTQAVKLNGLFYFNKPVSVVNEGGITTAGQNSNMNINGSFQSLSASDYDESWPTDLNASFVYNKDLETALDASSGNKNIYIMTNTSNAPDPEVLRSTPAGDIPDNGIWFKPSSSGNCIISFLVTDMGNDYVSKSIYKYTRNGDAIDLDFWTEVQFTFHKKGTSLGNKTLVVFEFIITEEDRANGCEYIIGKSSNDTSYSSSVWFYFLALAGASNSSGPITSTSREIINLNFIDALPYKYNDGIIAGENMTVTTFYIRLASTAQSSTITFNRELMTQPAVATYSATYFNVDSADHTIPAQKNE